MKCPYMQKALQQIVITEKAEDDEPNRQVLQETYDYQDCLKEQCGAWHRGRCRYKG